MFALWTDCRAELDEKTFLMGMFVLAAVVGLVLYAEAVSNYWQTILVGQ